VGEQLSFSFRGGFFLDRHQCAVVLATVNDAARRRAVAFGHH
jgi:hypothetical protein